MRGDAHLVIGACAAVPVALLGGGHLALFPCALAGAVGGLLPDIDHPHSTLGRCVPWPAVETVNHRTGFVAHGRRWFGGRKVWHRGETHSVGASGIAAIVAGGAVWWPSLVAMRALARVRDIGLPPGEVALAMAGMVAGSVLAGYLSHLVADLANVSPQMLWWPFSRRLVRVWRGIREADGRWAEVVGMAAACAGAVLLWSGRPL